MPAPASTRASVRHAKAGPGPSQTDPADALVTVTCTDLARRHTRYESACRSNSLNSLGLPVPLLTFMHWPTRKPMTF